MSDPVIMWFRQDLRISDNPALSAAAEGGRPVLAIFVCNDDLADTEAPGGASRWWLHHNLRALDQSLRSIGSHLLLRRGPAVDVLLAVAAETGARSSPGHKCSDSVRAENSVDGR